MTRWRQGPLASRRNSRENKRPLIPASRFPICNQDEPQVHEYLSRKRGEKKPAKMFQQVPSFLMLSAA